MPHVEHGDSRLHVSGRTVQVRMWALNAPAQRWQYGGPAIHVRTGCQPTPRRPQNESGEEILAVERTLVAELAPIHPEAVWRIASAIAQGARKLGSIRTRTLGL